MGEKGHDLINGGANVGLMEAVTVAAKAAGASATGILPERMIGRSLASDHSSEIIVTSDMAERKARMRDMSDAFIALPGGFGTLEEIMEVITLKQLSYHNKPIVFINTNQFYEGLLTFFETFFAEHFAKELYRELYHVAASPEEALFYIETYSQGIIDDKWHKVPGK